MKIFYIKKERRRTYAFHCISSVDNYSPLALAGILFIFNILKGFLRGFADLLTNGNSRSQKGSWSWKSMNLHSREVKYIWSTSVGRGWVNLNRSRRYYSFFAALHITPSPHIYFRAPHGPDMYKMLSWLVCIWSEEWKMGWQLADQA